MFLVVDPYKPSFATVAERRDNANYDALCKGHTQHIFLLKRSNVLDKKASCRKPKDSVL